MKHESRILFLAVMTGATGSVVALIYIWGASYTVGSKIALTVLLTGMWLGLALHLQTVVAFPLRTVSNLIGALREGDYALRARRAGFDVLVAGGVFGTCLRNPHPAAPWAEPSLTLGQRLAALHHPKYAIAEKILFARRHLGPLWLLTPALLYAYVCLSGLANRLGLRGGGQ